MTDENPPKDIDQEQNDRHEQRMMWIFSGAIVLLILGGMGANMLFHRDKPTTTEPTDLSSQARTAPAN